VASHRKASVAIFGHFIRQSYEIFSLCLLLFMITPSSIPVHQHTASYAIALVKCHYTAAAYPELRESAWRLQVIAYWELSKSPFLAKYCLGDKSSWVRRVEQVTLMERAAFLLKLLMERGNLQDLGINKSMLLESVRTVFKWLGIGTSGWTL
jgi:hypothetical protein